MTEKKSITKAINSFFMQMGMKENAAKIAEWRDFFDRNGISAELFSEATADAIQLKLFGTFFPNVQDVYDIIKRFQVKQKNSDKEKQALIQRLRYIGSLRIEAMYSIFQLIPPIIDGERANIEEHYVTLPTPDRRAVNDYVDIFGGFDDRQRTEAIFTEKLTDESPLVKNTILSEAFRSGFRGQDLLREFKKGLSY